VEECLRESGIKEGMALVNAMHITASVYINDNGRGLLADYEDWLEELAPYEPVSHYRHNRTGEDNGDVHLKRQIMGREVVTAITDGRLDFGPWEQIFYAEFDRQAAAMVLIWSTMLILYCTNTEMASPASWLAISHSSVPLRHYPLALTGGPQSSLCPQQLEQVHRQVG
jgi:secondary thiamine-phosphate synthase enzyme